MTSNYEISEDPMKNFDEEDSKIILEYMKKGGKPIKKKYLNNAVRNKDGSIYIDFQINKKGFSIMYDEKISKEIKKMVEDYKKSIEEGISIINKNDKISDYDKKTADDITLDNLIKYTVSSKDNYNRYDKYIRLKLTREKDLKKFMKIFD